MRILLSGYYGSGNVGDEAVLESMVQEFKRRVADIEMVVISASPELTTEFYQVKSIHRYNLIKILREMLKADIFVSGGGTLFQDSTSSRSFWYYLGLILLAKVLRKKTAVFAQGFGPLRKNINQKVARLVLNRVDFITLRDDESYRRLKEIGVKKPPILVTADPSFMLAPPGPLEGKKILSLEGIPMDRPLIGVSIRSLPRQAALEERVSKALAESLDQMVRKFNCQPVFMLLHCPEDIREANAVINLMQEKSSVVFRICHPKEIISLISRFDLLIGMRLHALIFAAMNGVPMLGISYDPKVESFMKFIDQPCFSLDESINADSIIEKIEAIWSARENIKADLKKKQKGLHDNAALTFELFYHHFGCCLKTPEIIEFAGIKVDNISLSEAIEKVEGFLNSHQPHLITTPNPEMIVASQTDNELKEILNSADLRIPDGISMVVVSKLLGKPLKERVTGIDLMLKMIELSAQKGYKVFFLGGEPGVAEAAAQNLIDQYPVNIVGTHHGYFSPPGHVGDDSSVIKRIKEVRPDILFVGLGAGHQEKWLNRHLKELGVKVGMTVGGSFDVISGRKKRAPQWIRSLYIEWLYRLITEPQRWKRQLALPKFLWLMLTRGR